MKISAVLLAGGQSRRMGEDKATFHFRGKPLWQIQLSLLRSFQPVEILISARKDPTWRSPDVKFVADDPPSRGPLSGLAAALSQIRSGHLLALAIDMPFMNADHLHFLCGQIEPGYGVVPMIGDRAEPLAAIYPVEAGVDLAAAFSGGDFSLQALTNRLVKIGKMRAIRVSKEEEIFYRNLNEPADFGVDLAGASDRSK
jgi:molybdopterin-guanine dinucleotide biosynthesis protein A